jgi:hypothetical protein
MANHVAIRQVYPDTGIVLDRRAGNQQHLVTSMQSLEVGVAPAEDSAVDSGPEARRPLRRERRWCTVSHGPNLFVCSATATTTVPGPAVHAGAAPAHTPVRGVRFHALHLSEESMSETSVYLDHAATTPIRPEVRAAMAPYLDERFGNPSSLHRWGRQARNALEEARERVAAVLGASRREIIFTSGGTEADNLAILGRWRSACGPRAARAGAGVAAGAPAGSGVVAYSAIEHKAVSAAAKCAAEEGADLILLAVDEDGIVQIDALDEALRVQPCVVSVMWANNEVGSIQPVIEIGTRCRAAGVVFHTDAVQAFGKVPVRVDHTPCDLLAISAHKVGGPKGIGALYIRDSTVVLPLVHGGGQERELRPGTENVPPPLAWRRRSSLLRKASFSMPRIPPRYGTDFLRGSDVP